MNRLPDSGFFFLNSLPRWEVPSCELFPQVMSRESAGLHR